MEFSELFVLLWVLDTGITGNLGRLGFMGLASKLTIFFRDGSSLEYTHGSAGKGWF